MGKARGNRTGALFLWVLAVLVFQVAVAAPAGAEVRAEWSNRLGIYFALISAPLAQDLQIPERRFLVLAVAAGGPAQRAGICRGDVVVRVAPELLQAPGILGTVTILQQANRMKSATSAVELTVKSDDIALNDARFPAGATGAKPRTITVSHKGQDDFRTITAGLVSTRAGDTVRVNPGIYAEDLVLPSGATIEGAGKGLTRVISARPVQIVGAHDVMVRGLTAASTVIGKKEPKAADVFLVANSKGVSLSGCEALTQQGTAVRILGSNRVSMTHCGLSGTEKTTGVVVAGNSEAVIAQSILSGHRSAVILVDGARAAIIDNLFDANINGISALDSHAIVRNNSITGKGNAGITVKGGLALIEDNAIRLYRNAIASDGAEALIRNNTVSQNGCAVGVFGGWAKILNNAIFFNFLDGVTVQGQTKTAAPGQGVEITGNSISNNGIGINVSSAKDVVVSRNLIEANTKGLMTKGSRVDISHNTVVYQSQYGIDVAQNCHARLSSNISAFNSVGIAVDVTAQATLEYNDVYGNLLSHRFPTVDGNYLREDRLPTATGEHIHIAVYPAYDLKGKTDLAVDPGFVAPGKDYRLRADSMLRKHATEGRVIGAFAPSNDR
jgi:hypothetical protein